MNLVRKILFQLLRAYAWTVTTRLWRWLADERADVILEPLPTPDDGVPEVHDARSVFIAHDQRAAYTHDGMTLRRVAVNDAGELVYIKRADKKQRRAIKRAKRRDGSHS